MTVDTLSLAKELREAELSSTQAEAIAAAIGRSVQEGSATKADLEQVRLAMKADVEQVRLGLKGDVEQVRLGLKGDIEQVRLGLKGEIEQVRLGLKGEIEQVRTEIEKLRATLVMWFIGAIVSVGGIVIAVSKL